MIFYSENWLWKSDLGTCWWPVWKSNRKNLELIFEQKSTHSWPFDHCLQNFTTEVALSKHYLFCLINIMKNFLNVVLFMDFLWALVHELRPQPITWVSIAQWPIFGWNVSKSWLERVDFFKNYAIVAMQSDNVTF